MPKLTSSGTITKASAAAATGSGPAIEATRPETVPVLSRKRPAEEDPASKGPSTWAGAARLLKPTQDLSGVKPISGPQLSLLRTRSASAWIVNAGRDGSGAAAGGPPDPPDPHPAPIRASIRMPAAG